MIDQGILEETDLSDYDSSCFLVKNKGSSHIIVSNYVHLNSITVDYGYPTVPNMEECMTHLTGGKWFSKADLRKA